ncbi:hypothetical protein AK812_SmicGene20826 [Symbiodinium microadriaticum]|uniref:Uncharacterized protein n=1 Tax=Symbiodinium microadriaticum TaxID=2951 RepID=A0A1Q9DNW7_SYMMI|nr:hypothetical protein AK812_SmicGene20826 [Symbiodinium microadriaticum]
MDRSWLLCIVVEVTKVSLHKELELRFRSMTSATQPSQYNSASEHVVRFELDRSGTHIQKKAHADASLAKEPATAAASGSAGKASEEQRMHPKRSEEEPEEKPVAKERPQRQPRLRRLQPTPEPQEQPKTLPSTSGIGSTKPVNAATDQSNEEDILPLMRPGKKRRRMVASSTSSDDAVPRRLQPTPEPQEQPKTLPSTSGIGSTKPVNAATDQSNEEDILPLMRPGKKRRRMVASSTSSDDAVRQK